LSTLAEKLNYLKFTELLLRNFLYLRVESLSSSLARIIIMDVQDYK
jgi:hypothetical protein